jgi:hypothetical protein
MDVSTPESEASADLRARLLEAESRWKKCSPPFAADAASTMAPEIEKIEAALVRDHFALVDSEQGRRATRAIAHAAEKYPGGVLWIPCRNTPAKDACADVIEALDLPCAT